MRAAKTLDEAMRVAEWWLFIDNPDERSELRRRVDRLRRMK